MADSFIGITEPAVPNKKLDSEQVTVGLNTVERERVQISGDSAGDIAPVTAAGGLLVEISNPTITIAEPVTVDAVDLDIRNLVFASDKVDVSGSTAVGVTGPLTDTQLRATPVPVSAVVGAPVNVQVGDGTNTASIRNLAANDALNVAIVDGAGAHITSFGGGVQYTEGDVDASITGTAIMWEDAGNTLTPVSAAKPLPVSGSLTPVNPSTGTSTNVNRNAASVTLLAANAARFGATVYNDSNANLFVKLGATASLTSFAVRLGSNSYYEIPFGYTGIIDGIWQTAGAGAARMTELT